MQRHPLETDHGIGILEQDRFGYPSKAYLARMSDGSRRLIVVPKPDTGIVDLNLLVEMNERGHALKIVSLKPVLRGSVRLTVAAPWESRLHGKPGCQSVHLRGSPISLYGRQDESLQKVFMIGGGARPFADKPGVVREAGTAPAETGFFAEDEDVSSWVVYWPDGDVWLHTAPSLLPLDNLILSFERLHDAQCLFQRVTMGTFDTESSARLVPEGRALYLGEELPLREQSLDAMAGDEADEPEDAGFEPVEP